MCVPLKECSRSERRFLIRFSVDLQAWEYAGYLLHSATLKPICFDSSRTHKLHVAMDIKINSNKIEERKNKLKQCFDQSDFHAYPKY
jgi:hypothetical protein